MSSSQMDERKEKAMLEALRSIATFLGKERDYHTFIEYVAWADKQPEKPTPSQIAANTPSWIQLLSPPLRKLYDSGYNNGRKEAAGY